MKAIVLSSFGSADNFAMADLPIPEVRKGEVRIKVRAVSFNPVDYQIRKGLPESSFARSMILGRDLSGSVDAVSENVTDFSVGDEVFGYVCNLASSGTYAEYVSVPAELVARRPASLTHEQAAAVPVAGITASIALSKAGAGKTKSVFVAGGAGGVGTFATLLAHHGWEREKSGLSHQAMRIERRSDRRLQGGGLHRASHEAQWRRVRRRPGPRWRHDAVRLLRTARRGRQSGFGHRSAEQGRF